MSLINSARNECSTGARTGTVGATNGAHITSKSLKRKRREKDRTSSYIDGKPKKTA